MNGSASLLHSTSWKGERCGSRMLCPCTDGGTIIVDISEHHDQLKAEARWLGNGPARRASTAPSHFTRGSSALIAPSRGPWDAGRRAAAALDGAVHALRPIRDRAITAAERQQRRREKPKAMHNGVPPTAARPPLDPVLTFLTGRPDAVAGGICARVDAAMPRDISVMLRRRMWALAIRDVTRKSPKDGLLMSRLLLRGGVEACRVLDVNELNRHDHLAAHPADETWIQVQVRDGEGNRRSVTQHIGSCDRPAVKLYQCTSYGFYRCRRCLDLAYESKREGACDRAFGAAGKIKWRRGGDPDFLALFPPPPQKMWRRTYERLWSRHREAGERVDEAFMRRPTALLARVP